MVPAMNSRRKLANCMLFAVCVAACLHPVFGVIGQVVEDLVDNNQARGSNRYYSEFTQPTNGFAYYPEEFEFDEHGRSPMEVVYEKMEKNDIVVGDFIVSDFVVGGVNLAQYGANHPPFLLYSDFDIGSYVINGPQAMDWKDLLEIRNGLERPSLSWYVDKVARKRWIKQEQEYVQPETYFTEYKDQLSDTGKKEDLTMSILANLPSDHGFCAKPTHMSMTMGNWLVDINPNQAAGVDETKFTTIAHRLSASAYGEFDPVVCADSLAEGLQREAAQIESWALKNVRPGIVIEELYSHHEDRSLPPDEFCLFVIWGKVYVGQWNSVSHGRFLRGFFYRDGSGAHDCPFSELPDWVPWDEMVRVAEGLGRHKDMFRVDMFVGVPRYSEEGAEPRIALSESEIHPTTMFCNPFIAEDMARLWVAGYRMGNYEVIPNDEVPEDFVGKNALVV